MITRSIAARRPPDTQIGRAQPIEHIVEARLAQHFSNPDRIAQLSALRLEFARSGYAEITDMLPKPLAAELLQSLHNGFDQHGNARDFINPTSQTARQYTSISQESLKDHIPMVPEIYHSKTFLEVISRVIGEPAQHPAKRWEDDHFVAHRAAAAGNEHGGHVDPFPFAAVYIAKAAPVNSGGELQFVDVPRGLKPAASEVPRLLTQRDLIRTKSPRTNSMYILRALEKPHYTTPLTKQLTKRNARVNVTFSFASRFDRRTAAQIDRVFDEEVVVSYPKNGRFRSGAAT